MAVEVSLKDMLEAGAHFGHQTRRWNPKMKPYIYGAKNGIHVINLQRTHPLLKAATAFVSQVVARGEDVLFVGTKPQARDVVAEEATRAGMPFVTYRWLGGMLTNHVTIRRSIQSIEDLDAKLAEGVVEKLHKKEVLHIEKRREKLFRNLEGIRNMKGLPRVLFIIDPVREHIAVAEAKRLGLQTVAICDTNCDPEEVDFPIPANDDAIKSIRLFVGAIADACLEGKESHKQSIMAGNDKAFDGGAVDPKVEVIVRGKGPRRKKDELGGDAEAAGVATEVKGEEGE